MLDDERLLTITDLKQYAYCMRIAYYHRCLPAIRPTTYKMEAGIEAGQEEQNRARRRTLNAYHLPGIAGRRMFDVPLRSVSWGLTGILDELVQVEDPEEWIPVDYKLSRKPGFHFKIQLAAYAVLLEETNAISVRRGFLYMIPLRRAEEVIITTKLRSQLREFLGQVQAIEQTEGMPPPCAWPVRCLNCEFRRFCNDV